MKICPGSNGTVYHGQNSAENDIKEKRPGHSPAGVSIPPENLCSGVTSTTSANKTVFGRTGNFEGYEIIDLLVEQKQTAVFITRKIYRYFVNELCR